MKERFFMQKRYQYCMSGMFAATDQNHYEINIPSPHTYETEEEAMADGAFGYRFVLLPGGKGPQVVIFEGSGFRLVCDGKENYIKDWDGNPLYCVLLDSDSKFCCMGRIDHCCIYQKSRCKRKHCYVTSSPIYRGGSFPNLGRFGSRSIAPMC